MSGPTAFVDPATGNVNVGEGGSVALTIAPTFASDPDAVNKIIISGVPTGITFNHGTLDTATGTLTLTPDQLAGLTMTAANTAQAFTLHVTATATEGTSVATSNVAEPRRQRRRSPCCRAARITPATAFSKFNITPISSDSSAKLISVTITGIPTDILSELTPFKFFDSQGNQIPFGQGVGFRFGGLVGPRQSGPRRHYHFPTTRSRRRRRFSRPTHLFNSDGSPTGLLNGLVLQFKDGSQSLEGQTFRLTLTATSQEANGTFDTSHTQFTLGLAQTPVLHTSTASGTQGTAFALPITVSGDPHDSIETLSVAISGLPTGASLSDTNGDVLTIVNGAITLTAAELAGLKLTSDGEDQHFDIAVTAKAVDNGNAATATTSTSTLHVDVTPTSGTTSAAATFDAVHDTLTFSNHTIETNTTSETVQLTDAGHAGATLSATGNHFIADGANELLDLSQWDRGIEIDFNAQTIRLDANTQAASGSLSGFTDILGTSHGDWFDNLTGGVTVDGGTSGAVDHFALAANVLNSANVPTINNFHASNEAIDLSALLDTKFGPGSNPSNAGNFIQLKEDGGGNSATLSVNVSGTAGGTFVTAAHLSGVHTGDVLTAILDHAHTQAQIHAA